ncbi:MAG: hypothetical protein H7Z42_11225 [Roseiflexaceae bacterium]|nr:hypothetical protein [Roseiflexaceae bacterium]
MMVRHRTIWAAPAPLWAEARTAANAAAKSAAISRPALLRFASDEFMDELALILERDPSQLVDLRTVEETWRRPAPRVAPPEPLSGLNRRLRQERKLLPRPTNLQDEAALALRDIAAEVPKKPYRLFHPAHQRFYLVAACLVCDLPGLPDHVLETGERAAFVVRRLRPKQGVSGAPNPLTWATDWDEYAFVFQGRERTWAQADETTMAKEEHLPLFPMTYTAEDGRRRRLLAGLVPVARRDAYMAAAINVQSGEGAVVRLDSRLALLRNDFVQAYWSGKELLKQTERMIATKPPVGDPPKDTEKLALRTQSNDDIQVTSWYALLDLSSYLAAHLPYVRKQIGVPDGVPFPEELPASLPARGLTPTEQALFAQLGTVSTNGRTLAVALHDIEAYRTKLESATQIYSTQDATNRPRADNWPPAGFSFRLTDSGLDKLFLANGSDLPDGRTPLEDLVKAALSAMPLRAPEMPPVGQPSPSAGDPAYFIVRCVYEKPGCGPIHPPIFSPPTLAFEPASFFEPDAPARPIRIALPIDSTPGGLRKYTKSVGFMLSDQLACQKTRMGNITFGDLVLSVLPWPFHKDLPKGAPNCDSGIGMLCSLSIPIITICALFLLIIFVTLLDIIFHWLPLFILCFPLPNFKGKKP